MMRETSGDRTDWMRINIKHKKETKTPIYHKNKIVMQRSNILIAGRRKETNYRQFVNNFILLILLCCCRSL
jgi:hypothetical protein